MTGSAVNLCAHCDASSWVGRPYADELAHKRELLRQALEEQPALWSRLSPELIDGLDVRPAPAREGYRNSAKLVFGFNKADGRARLGIYAPGSHRLIDMDHCREHHPAMAPILAAVLEGVRTHHLPVYHEEKAKGFLRYFLLRVLPDGRALCCFVTPHADGAWQESLLALAADLKAAFPELRGVAQNLNPGPGNAVLGTVTQLLAGQFSVPCQFLATPVPVTATSFLQANLAQFRHILEHMDALRQSLEVERGPVAAPPPAAGLRMADLFCGCGAIGRSITKLQPLFLLEGEHASQLPLVEGAREDGREEIEVVRGRVEECLTSLELFEPDLVIVDPPRKGLDESLCAHLLAHRPAAVLYLSCNPRSLARDLARLCAGGFTLTELTGWDMMPGTEHVEALALLR